MTRVAPEKHGTLPAEGKKVVVHALCARTSLAQHIKTASIRMRMWFHTGVSQQHCLFEWLAWPWCMAHADMLTCRQHVMRIALSKWWQAEVGSKTGVVTDATATLTIGSLGAGAGVSQTTWAALVGWFVTP